MTKRITKFFAILFYAFIYSIFQTGTAQTCNTPTGVNVTSITTTTSTINWSPVVGDSTYRVRYRISGATAWSTTTIPLTSKTLKGLLPATLYEYGVKSVCPGNVGSPYSAIATFTTLSSCAIPVGLTANIITSNSATLNWNNVQGAVSYNIQYKIVGMTTWITVTSTINSKVVSALNPNSNYQFQVQSVCTGGAGTYSSPANFITQSIVPTPDHIVILIMENHGYTQIMGSNAAPNINALAADAYSALFTQSYGIEHPSQPNYLDLYAGCNQGITNNNIPSNLPFSTPNLGSQLINAGKTFVSYSQSLPSVGYNGATSGNYARKHNPVTNWMGTGTNRVPTTTNQPFTAFPSTNFSQLPTVSFVIPDLTYDMHNGSDPLRITTGDYWFYTNLNNYVQWAKTHNSLFILTFDEDNGSYGNRIVTIFTGSMVQSGQYSNTINHYSILRTIEDMYGLPYACNAATATTISNCWKPTPRLEDANHMAFENNDASLSINPNPLSNESTIKYSLISQQKTNLEIYNLMGTKVFSLYQNPVVQEKGDYYFTLYPAQENLKAGVYFVRLVTENKILTERIIVTK